MELRRWLRVGFTGVAVDNRASALDGDSASWIAAICSADPTPGSGWSQTWSARRRDAPVEVERCESPDALRALLVEAADWGRCRGMLCLGGDGDGRARAAPRVGRLASLPASASVLRRPLDGARRCLSLPQRAEGQRLSRGPHPVSTSEGSGTARRSLNRHPEPLLVVFAYSDLRSTKAPLPPLAAHSANPCHLCCSNAASRRRIAAAAICSAFRLRAIAQGCGEQQHSFSNAARVCEEILKHSHNSQVQQQIWRRSTNS